MNLKKQLVIFLSIFSFFISAIPVFAHAVVKPVQVGVASFQTFTLSVPNEKDSPTISVRLVMPNGLMHVSPNVKSGWSIEEKKNSDNMVTEIIWSGGSIPAGQRDDFVFSAQVPAKESNLAWKAYQTYSDGKVVTWDQTPKKDLTDEEQEKMEQSGLGPYSTTRVVNDIKQNTTTPIPPNSSNTSLVISIVALAISVLALNKTRKHT